MLDEKGFVFIDERSNPYWCRMYNGESWFMYWHEAQKSWVTYRMANQNEVWAANNKALPENQAQVYHDLHNKFIGLD